MTKSDIVVLASALVASVLIIAIGVGAPAMGSPMSTTPTGQPTARVDLDGGVSMVNVVELCGLRVTWGYLDREVMFENTKNGPVNVDYLAGGKGAYRFPLPAFGTNTIGNQELYRDALVFLTVSSNGRLCEKKYQLGR